MSDRAHRAPFLRGRGLTSFVVTLSFLAMILSGAVLYAAPRGRDANWSGWTCLGLWREQWVAMHIVVSALLVLFGMVHLAFNWRPLWSYLHSRLKPGIHLWKELTVAVLLVGGLSAAAITGLPPARQLVSGSDQIKDSWSRTLPHGPIPHAELLTLKDIQQRTGVSAEILEQALRDEGFRIGAPHDSLFHLSELNDTTPAAVFEVLRNRFPEMDRFSGAGRGRGTHKRSFSRSHPVQ